MLLRSDLKAHIEEYFCLLDAHQNKCQKPLSLFFHVLVTTKGRLCPFHNAESLIIILTLIIKILGQRQKGVIARSVLLRTGGPLASELARHPVVLKVNDWVFCHGGLLPHHGMICIC